MAQILNRYILGNLDREQMIGRTTTYLTFMAIVFTGGGILLGFGALSTALKDGVAAAFSGGPHSAISLMVFLAGVPPLVAGAYGLRRRTAWCRMGAFAALVYLTLLLMFAAVNGSLALALLAASSAIEAYAFYADPEIRTLLGN